MDAVVQSNTRKTCRTCLRVQTSRKELISIFETDQTFPSKKIKFSEMLQIIADHPVHENDDLPKRICVLCLQSIRSCYFFKIQAENSYSIFLTQIGTCMLTHDVRIKSEKSVQQAISAPQQQQSPPIIMTSRTIETESFGEDLLMEIGSPKMQEQFRNGGEEEEDSDDQQINDYEPDFSDDESRNGALHAEIEGCGKSPDSGIIDDRSHENNYERQVAESQLQELREIACDICNKNMFSSIALARHKKNFHSENKCKFCRKRLPNYGALKLHVKYKHRVHYDSFRLNGQTNPVVKITPIQDIPECATCSATLVDKEALIRHHADCDKICIECGAQLHRKDYYFNHMEKEHGMKVQNQHLLECPFGCTAKFNSEKVLQNHIQLSHPDFEDSEDNESLSNDGILFNCPHCSSRFSNQRSLSQHIGSKHKPNVIEPPKTRNVPKYSKDEFIDKFFVRKSVDYHRCVPCQKDIHKRSIGLHLRGKHAAMKSYICELCPEGFFRIDYRHRHMGHVHNSQYRCTDCDIQFDRAYKFDNHMLQHGATVKNFKPEEGSDTYDLPCSKMKYIEDSSTFDYSSTLTMAMLRRPSIMSLSGIQTAQVEVPMTKDEFCEKHLIPLSDKFIHCSICQQKMMKSSIISHILWKHALKKPLKCAFCNERVVKNAARLSHMSRCHPNDYKCIECNLQYAKHELYVGHMREVHCYNVLSKPSSGEEDDLTVTDVRFVGQKNEDEVIEEPDMGFLEPLVKIEENFKFSGEGSSHQCKFCSRKFTSSKNLQIHKTHKHRAETLEIYQTKAVEDFLEVEPMTFEEFRSNYVEDVGPDVKCTVCDLIMKKGAYGKHIKSRHATAGAFRCAICPEAFFRLENRIQHMSSVHRGMFFCNCCNIQFYQNSRYAKHMKDMHEIDVDSSDSYEVDLKLSDLKFLPHVKSGYEEDQQSVASSVNQDMEVDEEQEETNTGAFSRDEFMSRFVRNLNKENRKCDACDKTISKNSLYNHLMRYHAMTLPFKCPFCDLRLERAQYRIRHIQMFHPDDYKCYECGLQFQTHAKFAEHMLVEHNSTEIPEKSDGEERDLSSNDIKYVMHRTSEEDWPEDEQVEQKPEVKVSHEFLKPWVKEEPKGSSVVHDSLIEERPNYGQELNYTDFKNKYVVDEDQSSLRCIPCDRVILRTSACAHLRLWHAITMCYNCEICPEGFQRVDYRQRHMKFSHPDDFKCEDCQLQFHRSTLYRQHMLENHLTKVDVKELKTKDEIDVPLENMKFIEHVPDSVRLRGSDGDAPRRGGRPSAAKFLEPINPDAGGLTYEEFNNQYIRSTPEGFKCVICRTTMTKFSVKKHLKRHHATSKAFYCELCPEGFQRPDLRVYHMDAVHHDSFRCFHCNFQFYMSSSYVEHMQTQHGLLIRVLTSKNKSEVDVPLDRLRFLPQKLDNDESAPILTSAGQSVSIPSRERPQKKNFDDIPDDIELTREQFFGKFFRSVKKLPGQTGELKSKCLACFKVFSSKNRLFHAMHNHALQRPFSCEICPQKFFISTKRTWHMNRFHPNDYKCSYCEIQFDRAFQIIDHMKEKHQIKLNIPVPDPDLINIPSDVMRYTKKVTAHRTLMKAKRLGVSLHPEEAFAAPLMDSFTLPDEESLKCNECHEEFESGRSLRIHMRNHTNGIVEVKPLIDAEKIRELKALQCTHECDICFKKFAAAFALNAHKKFKHALDTSGPPAKRRKVDRDKPKFDVECDICEFTSHRRDYVEHHVKAAHKPEFHCRHCSRVLSNFNLFIYHLSENHPKAKENHQRYHKCSECHRAFKTIENLKLHVENKHKSREVKPENYCRVCCVKYKDAAGIEIHMQNHVHKTIQKFMDNKFPDACEWEVVGVSEEVVDADYSVNEFLDADDPEPEPEEKSDPFQKMLEKKLRSFEPIFKFRPSSEDDKLDYLRFLKSHNGIYTCGICNKTKTVRKHMLHHLKQHKEVPTFQCEKCPEKFVFKRKYEKHLVEHESEINVDEHPKYQEIPATKSEIRCDICQMTFKLTIMMNRHNAQWHGEENELRELSMVDQKAKKEETKLELLPIKLLRCKHCLQAFIKPLELKEHLREKHNSESMDQPPDEATHSSFKCDKCKLSFEEKKFLENHQKFFCVHRQMKSECETPKNVINEQ